MRRTRKKQLNAAKDGYVVVSNRGYGNALKGTKIYYEGDKPAALSDDGRITFGKHILETLNSRFNGKFRWIITADVDSVQRRGTAHQVRTSLRLLKRMGSEFFGRRRDITVDIVAHYFSLTYPTYFTQQQSQPYVAGTLSRLLAPGIVSKLSVDDREAMNKFLPEYVASESLNQASLIQAEVQIRTLRQLATDLGSNLDRQHAESWWQTFIKGHILIIQQGYIARIDKMNVAIGNTKFPDFCLVTHDNYLDILEIKKPSTPLLKHDASRDNYYWDSEVSKAIVQVENYLENVANSADRVRSYIRDNLKIDLKVVRPRGIVLAEILGRLTENKWTISGCCPCLPKTYRL